MTAKDIFMKTLPFCWSKLGLGLLNIVICVVLFAILMGISLLFNSEGVAAVMIIVWFVLIGIVNFVINHYFAYLVKAGHVAVIAQTFKEGRVPDNCVSVGKAMVKERFGTANAYFAIDKLVSGAVKQLQRTLGRVTDALFGSLPGADSVKSVTDFFLNISLGYIDECCLSYTFYNSGQNAYKSACDGVVIYTQNWKHLLKNAAMTALTVVVSILVVTLVAFVLFGGAFRLLGWSGFVAFVLAVMLAWTIKFAFIDSWMMVKMMHGYMQVAPSTVITYDLYTRLSALSSSFKKLFNESRVTPMVETVVEPAAESAVQAEAEAPLTPIPTEETKPRFCPECGTPLKEGMAFCGNCGTKVG
ncbi:MAG: zinc ribbon domain-containing protein [Bacteroides sp.]|nr:zinc ribbon domain-containing protein [Bacteroides sp.]